MPIVAIIYDHLPRPETIHQSIKTLLSIALLQPEDTNSPATRPSVRRPFNEIIENSGTQLRIENSEPITFADQPTNAPGGSGCAGRPGAAGDHRLLHVIGNQTRNRLAHLLRQPTPSVND
jgi:hypothetical protein